MAAGQKTLAEASNDRFLLGIGVSHAPLVGFRGHAYEKPLSYMRGYLEAMQRAPFMAVGPSAVPATVIGAIRPKMLQLAGEKPSGSHTYFVPPEHTKRARKILGPDKMLCVAQAVVLESDPATARAAARQYMRTYVPALPNYTNNLRRLGFTDDDLAGTGSDRLIDALVAWGDVDAIAARVREHREAGADHVCIQVITESGLARQEWRELAPALIGTHD